MASQRRRREVPQEHAASGHAAQVLALFPLMSPGAEIVASSRLYGGSLQQMRNTYPKFGWSAKIVDADEPDGLPGPIASLIGPLGGRLAESGRLAGEAQEVVAALAQAPEVRSVDRLRQAEADVDGRRIPVSGMDAALAASSARIQLLGATDAREALRRLDHFRREGVSNLSHDLRSPLTATVTCLETLDGRWAGDAAREEDRRLVRREHHPRVERHARRREVEPSEALRGPLTDEQIILIPHVGDDILIQFITGYTQRTRDHDPPHRDYRHFSRSTTNINNHRAGRFLNRKSCANGCSHWFFN